MLFQFFQGRNRKMITGFIILILVLAMVVPICISFLV